MFNAKELKELMNSNSKEFKPFAIHLTDGVRYDIMNHDQMLVGHNSVEIAAEPDADGIASRFIRCAIIHITRIEQLQPA